MRYTFIEPTATIEAASAVMRERDADALVVMGEDGELVPMPLVWATDIVTRVVAVGLDPRVMTVSDLLGVIGSE